jgi:hypothetical protein
MNFTSLIKFGKSERTKAFNTFRSTSLQLSMDFAKDNPSLWEEQTPPRYHSGRS